MGGFHFTERVSVRFHLRVKPEDFTFCRKAKDFTFFDVWHTNVLLAVICAEKNAPCAKGAFSLYAFIYVR